MTIKNSRTRCDVRRREALERQEAHDALSTQEKINKLSSRRGHSHKERARLEKNTNL